MAATGRYKSRLLNYVIERSQDFKSQAARGLRYARTGLTWGAQALLYPIYVAFQTSRVVGRRLQSASGAKPFVQLPKPPDADTSLKTILDKAQAIADQSALALESSQSSTAFVPAETLTLEAAAQVPLTGDIWELKEADSDVAAGALSAESSLTEARFAQPASTALAPAEIIKHPMLLEQPISLQDSGEELRGELAAADNAALRSDSLYVRGVASRLNDRALVLTDNQNRLVTIPAEQQWELQQQIVRQVADFAYRQRQYRLRTQQQGQPLPPPKSDRPNLFPVVRWSRNLMGWMQQSPVAKKVNLFSELQLPPAEQPPTFPLPAWDPQSSMAIALTTLERVDAPLAQLEHSLEETYSQQIEPSPLGPLIRSAAAFFGIRESSSPVGINPDSALQFVLSQAQAIADQEAIAVSGKQLTGTESPALNPAAGPLATTDTAQPLAPITASAPTAASTPALAESTPAQTLVAEADPSELAHSKRFSLASVLERRISTTASKTTSGKASRKVYIRGIASALDNRALLLIDNQNRPISISAEQQWALQAQIVGQVSEFPELGQTLEAQPKIRLPEHQTEQAEESSAPIAAFQTESSAPTWKASYIETTATFTGYIKHPLEWVLEKLDRWLLHIERAIASIWQWIQLRFHPNR